MQFIFEPGAPYINFTPDHWIPLVLLSVIFGVSILLSKKCEEKQKYTIVFSLSLIPMACVLARMVCTIYERNFTMQEELPLHLCRLIAIVLPICILSKNIKWINTLYFLIITGTIQAVITADLQYTFPHYSYFLYWILHVSLIWISVFIIINLKITPGIEDLKRAFIVGNIYMIFTVIINFSIGSNYFYTRQKPAGGTLLDYFGPWPWYIFIVEILAVLLFTLAFLPFYKKENRQTTL